MPKATKLKSISRRQECRKVVGWNERLEELKQYKQVNGNCNVYPRSWVHTQRTKYKKGKLSPEQIKQLNDIEFEWVGREVVGWDERFEQLKAYNKEHGDCNVPRDYINNPQLATWVNTQRLVYNKKKKGKLSTKQIKCMEDIGFVWVLGRGYRPVREVSDAEDSVSGGEEETGRAASSSGDTQTPLPVLPEVVANRAAQSLAPIVWGMSQVNGTNKNHTAADRDEIAQSLLAPAEDEEDERGDDGSSFVVDEDDNNDQQNRNGLVASAASMQDKLQEVRLAHSRDVTQLKETHDKAIVDLKTSHDEEMALKEGHFQQMEKLANDTEAELEVVKGVCEKKDHLIEQMKALQGESNRKQCILEKQKQQVLMMHDAYKVSSAAKINHAKAEVSALKVRHEVEVIKLREELETARAKLPKAVSRSSRGKRESTSSLHDLKSELADDHDVKYLSSKKPRRSPRLEEEPTQLITTRREVRGPTRFVRTPREVYEPSL